MTSQRRPAPPSVTRAGSRDPRGNANEVHRLKADDLSCLLSGSSSPIAGAVKSARCAPFLCYKYTRLRPLQLALRTSRSFSIRSRKIEKRCAAVSCYGVTLIIFKLNARATSYATVRLKKRYTEQSTPHWLPWALHAEEPLYSFGSRKSSQRSHLRIFRKFENTDASSCTICAP